jgi:predicted ATPase
VELAAIREPTLVAQAVAQIGDAHELPGTTLLQSIGDSIGARKILLVLDNCEHLVPACAELVDRLLSVCENLRILVTSCEALDILGETTAQSVSHSPDAQEVIYADDREIERSAFR